MKSKTRKILVVEDDENSLCLLEALLGKSGYEVVSARNGVEALEKLRKNNIDMIVSDILMPKMDGFEFCRECKKDDSLKRIPFVFYTATYTDEKDEEFAMSLGAETFVVKPCEIIELLRILKDVIEAAPVASRISINDEETYLAKYNKRLVEKLENKVLALEKEIKKRKQTEKELKKSKDDLDRAQKIAHLGHWDWDIIDNTKIWSDEQLRIFGYETGEIVLTHDHFEKALHPDDHERVVLAIKSALEDNVPYEIEYRIIRPDGTERSILAQGEVFRDASGKPVKMLGTVLDITERKKQDDELRQNRKLLQSIFDGIQDGISVLDRDLNIIKVNQAMQEWYSHNLPLSGKKCFQAFHGKSEPCTVCPTIRAIENGMLQKDVVPFTGQKGRIGWLELFSFPLKDEENNVTGVIEYVRDITERKKVEEKLLEQKKALEQKNIALSEILGQIEIEKKQIKDNVIANAENLLLPIIQKLRLKGESRKYVQLLRKNLQELTSSFGAKLTEKRAKLTTREIEICNMIKNGLTNKEISRLLNISLGTTEKHRNNIRRKLHIVNKDINLSSFLNTL